jgi:hypothetical protein
MAGLYAWQRQLINGMQQYKGKGMVQITGRQTGKSILSSSAFQRLWQDMRAGPVTDLLLSEGTVYGARYHCVEPVGGNWMDMETWCLDTFGAPGDKIWDLGPAPLPAKRWYMNNRKFWFREEKDRNWFIIKWQS